MNHKAIICANDTEIAVVEASSIEALGRRLQAQLVTLHARFREQRLYLYVTDQGMRCEAAQRLRVQCLRCDVAYSAMAPPELVGALTIAFHSRHEGHPLSVEWDGVLYTP